MIRGGVCGRLVLKVTKIQTSDRQRIKATKLLVYVSYPVCRLPHNTTSAILTPTIPHSQDAIMSNVALVVDMLKGFLELGHNLYYADS